MYILLKLHTITYPYSDKLDTRKNCYYKTFFLFYSLLPLVYKIKLILGLQRRKHFENYSLLKKFNPQSHCFLLLLRIFVRFICLRKYNKKLQGM